MKALVKYAKGPGNLEIKNVPIPKIASDEVLVKVKASTIDRGGDLNVYHSPKLQWYNVPVILGNEVCGEIAEVGKEVKHWKLGERVVSEVLVYSCGECFWCRKGDTAQCPYRLDMGRRIDGTFAEYFKVRPYYLHMIPDNLSWDEAVLTENVAVAINNLVEKTGIDGGDIVAVIGPGPIGQMALQVAKATGASETMVLGIAGDEVRLNLAQDLGANQIVNISEEDPLKAIGDFTEGRGADVVVEASGSPQAVELAFDLVRPSGKIAQIGHLLGTVTVTWTKVLNKNINIYGSYAHRWTAWHRALKMMSSGQVSVKRLLSRKFPLEQWQEAFNVVENDRSVLKVALIP